MKTYIKKFMLRGLLAAAGGPVILAIIYGILGAVGVIDTLSVSEVVMGIITSALMAFIASGASVLYEIERLPLGAATLLHGAVLYLDYILIYLLNGWLASKWISVLVFTAIYIAAYVIIWIFVYLSVKAQTKYLNEKLNVVK